MIDVPRLMSAVLLVALLTISGTPVRAQSAGGGVLTNAQTLWDNLQADAFGVLTYSAGVVRSMTGWLTGTGKADDGKNEDVRSMLNLSEKEFRDFDTLVRATGYNLQGYSFSLDGNSQLEMVFDFDHTISDRERTEIRRTVEQQGGVANAARRAILLALLDASRYVDASPASGYRLAGVWMRLGSPPDVRIRFRRTKS